MVATQTFAAIAAASTATDCCRIEAKILLVQVIVASIAVPFGSFVARILAASNAVCSFHTCFQRQRTLCWKQCWAVGSESSSCSADC